MECLSGNEFFSPILFYNLITHEKLSLFVFQNEQALSGSADASSQASLKEADKHCKVILGRISRVSGCMKGGLVLLVAALAIGFAASPNVGSWDLKKLQAMLSSSLQSL